MKNILILIISFSFLLVSCGNTSNPESGSKKEQIKSRTYSNVSVSELNEAIKKGGDFNLLDVRTPGEVSDGYISDAKNFDINSSGFVSQAKGLDKSKTVYVYCRSGHRSQNASKTLIDFGFSDVRNVEGGFLDWVNKGYSVVK